MLYRNKNVQPFQCTRISSDSIQFYFANIYANDVDHVYEITYKEDHVLDQPIKLTSEWKNVSVVFLKPNTRYEFKYRVRDEDGIFTPWSKSVFYKTAAGKPSMTILIL
jgi:hypothetical protein